MAHRGASGLVDELARTLLGAPLPLSVRCWDGSESVVDGAPTLVVRNRRALRRLVFAPGELGLARAYVSGDLDVEGDLYAALSFPDDLPARPELRLDRRALVRLAGPLLRLRVPGPPPAPPAEEARLRGLRHSLRRDRSAISHHYDVGNDFYRLLLGPSLVYSCAYFPGPGATLEAAQEAKLDLVCRKLGVEPGMRLLDVGCGWGSLALHAASRYGVSVVGVTISGAQADLARRRVTEAGLADRVEIRLQDYREVDDGPFDAIASVGMAEHVGHDQLPAYAARLHALLAPGGRLLNHAIARGPAAGPDRPDPGSFLTRYVFPDGELQPVATHVRVLEEAGFEVVDVEALRRHYALTCRAWVRNLEENWEEAVRESSPGRARVWRLYLAGSALAFERHRVGVNQVLAVRPGGEDRLPLRRPDRSRPR
ncbi:class I SAM-dependent methyltransferase [Blastococcus sp. MG754426]|uniref:SAM-dependent methyltransferase n=1 Tax=unclassified Blastococcus TaxID=2619396 RepID=UPI001EF0C8FC|nr:MULTISPECIES: cyclopropane-fatty-acyl-phospholipid synthase family protein [unclassified Blastococcus]MCF6507585.1 class I SAM-dependent methyltransferase [Blastococcus sp. MG754426]MCF6511977.1 class I SAM-dependent methyltransferase [Blastococcus sp. MG754427]